MAFEAISRGAKQAVIIERKFPNVRLIEQNAAALGIAGQIDARAGDTFLQYDSLKPGTEPWLVFCCPPYEFNVSRTTDMVTLLEWFCQNSPPGSLIVVEADQRFDLGQLPDPQAWDVRSYPPAVISILEKPSNDEPGA